MTVQIIIDHVPKAVRDELAERAAREGKSMQDYLRQSLETLAFGPSPEQWVAEVRRRKSMSDVRVPIAAIVDALDRDRR
ncbi:hypothetical protein AB833_09920 [Chromatiales bacterium (ex Bugula neritina AB1)]|nr:hypothetical protein AB833_09920 [Chromatiales bacterium (ex Bugula neritina AB1)]